MFNILITVGGTVEKIDNVRSIINHSTGALGMEIASAFLNEGCMVTCIVGTALAAGPLSLGRPFTDAGIIPVTDVASLQTTIQELLSKQNFDAIIHAMAVSDFKIKNPPSQGKIDSNAFDSNELILTLEKTPKIISMLKGIAPNAILVGFKLTSGLSEEETISEGQNLLIKNNCDFVLANDTASLNPDNHKGYLIQKDAGAALAAEPLSLSRPHYKTYYGKPEIAKNITKAVLERLKK
jgi:phosphopantothenate-cysteine ligase